jgi:chemotaxis protein CheC
MSLPTVLRGDGSKLFTGATGEKELVLFLYINFEISQKEIRGYLALLMDIPSLEMLRSLVQDFLDTVSPKGAGS